jgi:Ca2+-binding RTX toxin-like protein
LDNVNLTGANDAVTVHTKGSFDDVGEHASFSYTATGSSESATVGVDVAGFTWNYSLGHYELMGATDNAEIIVDDNDPYGDIINAKGGNDIVFGNGGNDILIGGTGSDILVGGTGADTFKWGLDDASASGTVDVIKDFSKAQGDVLDLKDLLQGEHSTTTYGWSGHDANLDSYLNFTQSGANTVLTVTDTNGSSAGGNSQTIVFENANLFTQFAATAGDSHDLIAKMLTAQALKTDA